MNKNHSRGRISIDVWKGNEITIENLCGSPGCCGVQIELHEIPDLIAVLQEIIGDNQ